MKADVPVFHSVPAREAVWASFVNPYPGQWCVDRKSLEAGAPVPKALVEGYGIKLLPHILVNGGGWVVVSEGVRDVIEALDKGVHAFTDEVSVSYKDGRKSEHQYYGLAWGDDLKGTVNVPLSPWYPKGINPSSATWPKDKVPFYSLGGANMVAINRFVIGSRHLWRSSDYGHEWFCSEAMYAALKKLKVRGLRYLEQPLV